MKMFIKQEESNTGGNPYHSGNQVAFGSSPEIRLRLYAFGLDSMLGNISGHNRS
jgi:hypothetical protein